MKLTKTTALILALAIIVIVIIALPSDIKTSLIGQNAAPEVTLNETNKNIRPLQGEITEIAEGKLGNKDSYLISVNDSNGNTNVYITTDTSLKSSSGSELQFENLKIGSTVVVIGEPTEGGVEAREVILLGI